jgi:type VI protein secretion system component VasF
MESSAYTHPSTSECQPGGYGPTRISHEDRALEAQARQEAGMVVRSYERFLELPVWAVLAAMWAAGVALMGSCASALYLLTPLMLQIMN